MSVDGRRLERWCAAAVVGIALGACSASPSDVGGGKLTATGCQPRVIVGAEMKIRVRWAAPEISRYTLVRLDGTRDFQVKSVVDETLSRAQPTGVSGEYDLPGPRTARTTKTIVALLTAAKAGSSTITVSVWGSGNVVSAAPSDVSSIPCAVEVRPSSTS